MYSEVANSLFQITRPWSQVYKQFLSLLLTLFNQAHWQRPCNRRNPNEQTSITTIQLPVTLLWLSVFKKFFRDPRSQIILKWPVRKAQVSLLLSCGSFCNVVGLYVQGVNIWPELWPQSSGLESLTAGLQSLRLASRLKPWLRTIDDLGWPMAASHGLQVQTTKLTAAN